MWRRAIGSDVTRCCSSLRVEVAREREAAGKRVARSHEKEGSAGFQVGLSGWSLTGQAGITEKIDMNGKQ